MRFVDTNVFIRFITGDDATKAAACLRLFERFQRGEEEATTSEAVITEIVYVLSSPRQPYRLNREDIRARLMPLLRLRGLRLAGRATYVRALELFERYGHLDFEDALSVAHLESAGATEIVSYDRGFGGIAGIRRSEP